MVEWTRIFCCSKGIVVHRLGAAGLEQMDSEGRHQAWNYLLLQGLKEPVSGPSMQDGNTTDAADMMVICVKSSGLRCIQSASNWVSMGLREILWIFTG